MPANMQPGFIQSISANLAKAAEEMVKKIPESVFSYHFLPLFAGELSPEDSRAAMWEQVAGNAFMEVDVVDDKTGEVIYRVPALYDMEGLNATQRPEGLPSMGHVLISMQQWSRIHPSRGAAYLEHQLALRGQSLKTISPALQERIDKLNVIFARYNKPLIKLSDDGKQGIEDPNAQTTNKNSGDEPELVYD